MNIKILAMVSVSIIILVVVILYVMDTHAKHQQYLDDNGLKEACVLTGYHDYTSFMYVNHMMIPIHHHTPIYDCKVVPK